MVSYPVNNLKRGDALVARVSSRSSSFEDKSLDLYLKEISQVPLLTAEQEVMLAKRIKKGDKAALDHLTQANLRFVVNVAKQYTNQGLSLSDLINEGNIGLIKAAKRFDETKGFKFISYAVWWIKQAILQALAEQSRIVRLPLNRAGTLYKIGKLSNDLGQEFGREPTPAEIAEELALSVDEVTDTMSLSNSHLSLDAPFSSNNDNRLIDFLPDDYQPSPDQSLMEDYLRMDIEKALRTLTKREAEVISLYFGINREKPLTLEEIGQKFGLSRERVRQIKEKAIRRLRHVSRSRRLKAYIS